MSEHFSEPTPKSTPDQLEENIREHLREGGILQLAKQAAEHPNRQEFIEKELIRVWGEDEPALRITGINVGDVDTSDDGGFINQNPLTDDEIRTFRRAEIAEQRQQAGDALVEDFRRYVEYFIDKQTPEPVQHSTQQAPEKFERPPMHIPTRQHMQLIGKIDPLLRQNATHPNENGPPRLGNSDTEAEGYPLAAAALNAEVNMAKPKVQARIEAQDDQREALETYRGNFIASAQSDVDQTQNEIDARRFEIRQNTPSRLRRLGGAILNAASYIPGLDLAVAQVQVNRESDLMNTQRNLQYWRDNPNNNIRLEKANKVYDLQYGGGSTYGQQYTRALAAHRKNKDRKHVFDLEREIKELQQLKKQQKREVRDLRNGKSL